MQSKIYLCEVPYCGRTVQIRSTIKTGEFSGLKCCTPCKDKYNKKPVKKQVYTQKITDKTLARRKEERSGLPEFFARAVIELQRNPVCENCGCKINAWSHPVSNIAHILPKSRYKSVMVHQNNMMFLCTEKDHPYDKPSSCHGAYDYRINVRSKMPVYPVALSRFLSFEHQVEEHGNERLIFENNGI